MSDESDHGPHDQGRVLGRQNGEPCDTSSIKIGDTAISAKAMVEAFRGKSAFYADDYLAAVHSGAVRPVPVLAVQAWGDSSLPVETLQMYRKLKAADPSYPITLVFVTGEHGAEFSDDELRYVNDNLLNSFLDSHLKKEGPAPTGVLSFPTQCPIPTSKPPLLSGRSWDGMRAGILRLKQNGSRTTVSSPANAAEEGPAKSGRCITQSPGSYDDQADWTWSVPDNGFTLLGLPTVKVKYQLAGEDAIVVAKLWDVGPDGTRTLVTRGVYRLSVVGGDQRSGKIAFQLFGNHWKFERGHSMTLELSQTDAPFLRSDDLPSSITFTEPQVDLPKERSPWA